MTAPTKRAFAVYMRNFVFGVEDSLVSTLGLLSGIAIAGMSRRSILLTGLVLIAVEAFSMGVGSFLSERSSEKYMRENRDTVRRPFFAGVVMLISYFIAGFVPLLPYLLIAPSQALGPSISLSLVSLFLLGAVNAKIFRTNVVRQGLEMLVIGGAAAAVGILVGNLAGRIG